MRKDTLDSVLENLRQACGFDSDCFVEQHFIETYAEKYAEEHADDQRYVNAVITQRTHEEKCEIVPDSEPRKCVVIEMKFMTPNLTVDTDSSLNFYYFDSKEQRTGLIIVDKDDNMVYWRDVEQNPRTEWQICSLAQDLTDENGSFVFDGDPYNI